MVASQGGRHHCECNDPEIFQTTLSTRQPGSCLSHYERVIDQPDSKIHSETECRCSQTHTVKWQEEMMFFCCEVDFRCSDYNVLETLQRRNNAYMCLLHATVHANGS